MACEIGTSRSLASRTARDGTILRAGPTAREESQSPAPPQELVIVGFGMVGFKLVERLSALHVLDRFQITLIGEEPYPVYDRIHLTEWLDHGDFDHLALGRPGWREMPGVRTLTGDRVTSIDRESRAVHTAGGLSVPFDRLVLATGASAFRPPIEGANRDGVVVYRTLDDLKQIHVRSKAVSSAVVVGGGLLGIETAEALNRRGLDVTLLESGPYLMKRQLDPETAAHLESNLREKGIPTIANARAHRIERIGQQLALAFSETEEPLLAGMIVFATGVRPRDELARQAGLDVDPRGGGIVIDDQLRTTDPAIHAIGDCASHRGVSYGLVAPRIPHVGNACGDSGGTEQALQRVRPGCSPAAQRDRCVGAGQARRTGRASELGR